ncbi:GNAT family N-acetyltransferase [Pantoea vagans]|uniref:GNAT family N-acetyltransferase n=1 Tax=Pantoea vagans TaxID=470934 RepID=UPI0030164BB4
MEVTVDECLVLRQAVLWPLLDVEQCRVEGDDGAAHFGAFHEAELVCCLSVFSLADGACQIRKFATRQQYQGQGYGTALMESVLDTLSEKNIRHIFLDARTSAISFYKKLGFVCEGAAFKKNNIEYIRMNHRGIGLTDN